MEGGVTGGLLHGVSRGEISSSSWMSVKLIAKGERGVGEWTRDGLAEGDTSITRLLGLVGVRARGSSGRKKVEGVGERSAKGSSSKRSAGGGEFRLFLLGDSSVVGLMGIAGGSTKLVVDAAAECDLKRDAVGEVCGEVVALSAG